MRRRGSDFVTNKISVTIHMSREKTVGLKRFSFKAPWRQLKRIQRYSNLAFYLNKGQKTTSGNDNQNIDPTIPNLKVTLQYLIFK